MSSRSAKNRLRATAAAEVCRAREQVCWPRKFCGGSVARPPSPHSLPIVDSVPLPLTGLNETGSGRRRRSATGGLPSTCRRCSRGPNSWNDGKSRAPTWSPPSARTSRRSRSLLTALSWRRYRRAIRTRWTAYCTWQPISMLLTLMVWQLCIR